MGTKTSERDLRHLWEWGGGVYALLFHLPRERRITVGRLGPAKFPQGYYLYVGSAQNGVEVRLKRHLLLRKAYRWHIDYLSSQARALEATVFRANKGAECRLNERIARLEGAEVPLRGFGSSGCRCTSHLHYFPSWPAVPFDLLKADAFLVPL